MQYRRSEYSAEFVICTQDDEGRTISQDRNLSLISYDIKLDWLETLNFYIDKIADTLIIDNVGTYKIDKNRIVTVDSRENRIYNLESEEFRMPLTIVDDKIMTASILLPNPVVFKSKDYDEDYLIFNILHELSHLKDIVDGKLRTPFLNRTLLDRDIIRELNRKYDSENDYIMGEYVKFLTNMTYDLRDKIEIIRKADYRLVSETICKLLYVLNKSEIRARIYNFMYELSRKRVSEINKEYAIENSSREAVTCRLSETYQYYWNCEKLLDMFVRYCRDDIKREFYEKDIRPVYGKTQDVAMDYQGMFKNFPNSYDDDFEQESGKAEDSFDGFMEYQEELIRREFLDIADNVVTDIRSAANPYKYMLRENYQTQRNMNRIDENDKYFGYW